MPFFTLLEVKATATLPMRTRNWNTVRNLTIIALGILFMVIFLSTSSRYLNTCRQQECTPCKAVLPPPSLNHTKREMHENSVKPQAELCAGERLFIGGLCVPNALDDTTRKNLCGGGEPSAFDGANDFCRFYTGLGGIVSITHSRWRAAQSVESSVWHEFQGNEDRNEQHSSWFGHYQTVDGRGLGRLLEIGSGPFTQTKTVLEKISSRGGDSRIESITLADPLMLYYHLHVPSCSYKDGSLMGHPTQFIAAGGEELYLRDVFDTVIMINVLEHCHDALRVLQNLHESVRPGGGLLIFSERWYDFKWSKYEKEQHPIPFWDIMHPINIKRAVVEALLSQYEPLYRRDFFYEGSYPTDEGVYFIGVKK